MQTKISTIVRKEVAGYFSSPIAFIFLFTFLAVNLFIFFWFEAFFARNIADVRPLFEWMPILLIFLVASLTMRMWSEERRMGTLEFLLTLPVSTLRLVFGKFLACMVLVAIALALTLPVPITVAFLGDLDWGPVLGAYLATLFLAGAYTSVGLFVSSRSDNQIVSLIVTALICFVFFMVGSNALTGFLGNQAAEFAKLLGTGSRFASITRGVIDLRDLYYYVSIIGVFLSLNVLALESLKWAHETRKPRHALWRTITLLAVANFILANFWLQHFNAARADVTRTGMYSISPSTRNLLEQLQEPLLIRGYFSSRTHPLLAPLVPQLRDLIQEYAVAGRGKLRAEFIDPRENQELEEEANRKFGIKPIPFQVSDKYQAALVNSYFDIVIQYGDKFETLGFRELIEVKVRSETDIEVQLRNPEYDITRSIKKVLYGFQSMDSLFAGLKTPVTFRGYISASEKLPEQLKQFRDKLQAALDELKQTGKGKFEVDIQDPEANGGALAKEIGEKYNFRPMVANLFNPQQFYFYLLLQDKERVVQLPLPENLDQDGARKSIEAGLKRFSVGFLKTIGVHAPTPAPSYPWAQDDMASRYDMIRQKLSEGYTMRNVDLQKGIVPEDVDLLLLVAPKALDNKQLFAVDQFLMKGGTVVLASSPFSITRTQSSVSATKQKSGLEEWLRQKGLELQEKMVLDPQNENYPVPVRRNLGAFAVEEIRLVPYPCFVDIRAEGMNQKNMITSGIPQVTMNWPSPLMLSKEVAGAPGTSILLSSSPAAWTTDSAHIEPNYELYGDLGFPALGERKSHVLAAVVEGAFDSYFKGKNSPLLEEQNKEKDEAAKTGDKDKEKEKKEEPPVTTIIDRSPSSARIIVFASNEFLNDQTLRISAAAGSNRFLNSLQLVENAIDWSLEDRSLLAIRNRGQFSRTLKPLNRQEEIFWEVLNYLLAALGLGLAYAVYRYTRSQAQLRYREILAYQGE